jgi:hypothetical protein
MAQSEVPSIQQEPPGSIVNSATGGQELTDKIQHLDVSEIRLKSPAAVTTTQDPTQGIKRQDSETGEVDEFQDAED